MIEINKKKYIICFIVIYFIFAKNLFAKVPNDPGYDFQWYLENIGAPDAWDITTGSRDVIVAVLDSGVDITHPDLKKNIWVNMDEIGGDNIDNDGNGYIDDVHGWDFIGSDSTPNPEFDENCIDKDGKVKDKCALGINHGTIVAGVIAAEGDNKRGIAGISWKSRIMPLRILDGEGNGDSEDVGLAIEYAVENGADIINLSLIGEGYSKSLEKILRNAYSRGVVLVAAAGNNDKGGVDIDKSLKYPICYRGENGENIILGVSGINKDNELASFSNYGSDNVDLAAPAEEYYGTSVFEPKYEGFQAYYTGYWSGTSLSTPLVSGLAALIKSERPNFSNKKIYNLIINNTVKASGKNVSGGKINLVKTLRAINNEAVLNSYILTAPQSQRKTEIRQFRNDGIFIKSFSPYDDFTGGINIAGGDVNGSGMQEIISSKKSGSPEVKIFDSNGNMKKEFLAYGVNFTGGVNIYSKDLDGDSIDEIITGTGYGGGPQVRIFDGEGNVESQFFAYADTFRGGVNITAGDIDGDGIAEIITGAGKGGRSHIRIFNKKGEIKSHFFAYNDNFFGGVNVAAGDLDGDGIDEIITAPFSSGGPHVIIFDSNGNIKSQFFAYEKDFHEGLNIVSGDVDSDGVNEIIVGKGGNGKTEIKIFDVFGKKKLSFYAFEENFNGGASVGIIKQE